MTYAPGVEEASNDTHQAATAASDVLLQAELQAASMLLAAVRTGGAAGLSAQPVPAEVAVAVAGRLQELVQTEQALVDLAKRALDRPATAQATTEDGDLLAWAGQEAAAIVSDARARATELALSGGEPLSLDDLGQLLVSHFDLEERLVNLVHKLLVGPAATISG